MSELEAPLEAKNWNFGKTLLWGLHVSKPGILLKMLFIWEFENPLFLKKAITESGFSAVSKRTRSEALRAVSGEKAQLLMR